MRILLTADTVGGVWTFARELSSQLLKMGHAVALVGFGRDCSPEQAAWCDDQVLRSGDRFLCRPSSIPLEWMEQNHRTLAEGAELILETAREFKPDIIHANEFCWGALPTRIPRLVTAHSDVLSWAAACRPKGLVPSPWLKRYTELVQRGLHGASAVAAPTHWMSEALQSHFRVRSEVQVIPNGRRVRATRQKPRRKLQAISAGRLWDEAKAIDTLSCITSAMPIVVAGEHTFGSSPTCTGNLEVLGRLDEDSLFQAFRSSSVYIATSIYEPFGLAPLEAALCGCALLARDIPSLREVWGSAALYFSSPSDLSDTLAHLTTNAEALAAAQRAALARAQRYTAARMARRYLAMYRALVEPEHYPRIAALEQTFHAV